MKNIHSVPVILLFLFCVGCNDTVTVIDDPEIVPPITIVAADKSKISDKDVRSYYLDAAILALREIQKTSSETDTLVEIPLPIIERYHNALLHIFLSTSLAERDSIVSIYNIHCFPEPETRNILIDVDSSFSWTRNWRNGNIQTGNKTIDDLVQRFSLRLVRYYSGKYHQLVTLEATDPINVKVISERFSKIPGIKSASPNSIIGDGNEIKTIMEREYLEFTFSYGFGDCPSGCIKRRYWVFRVYEKGTVDFIKSYGSKLS